MLFRMQNLSLFIFIATFNLIYSGDFGDINAHNQRISQKRADAKEKIRQRARERSCQRAENNLSKSIDRFNKNSSKTSVTKLCPVNLADIIISHIKEENFSAIRDVFYKAYEACDLNDLIGSSKQPLIYYIIYDFLGIPTEFKLDVIEYLIQNGLDLNIFFNVIEETPLEYTIKRLNLYPKEHHVRLYLKLIALLIINGANITESALKKSNNSEYRDILMETFEKYK